MTTPNYIPQFANPDAVQSYTHRAVIDLILDIASGVANSEALANVPDAEIARAVIAALSNVVLDRHNVTVNIRAKRQSWQER